MKALVYTGPNAVEMRDVPEPTPIDADILVQVESVGICGSDLHAYLGHDGRRPAPLILGHEASGIVLSGENIGRRVTVNPLVSCMECDVCKQGRENLCAQRQIISMMPREGAFAQRISIPERNLVTVPDHVSFDQAALAEPMACGWHAVRLAMSVVNHLEPSGLRVLVQGGGAIGTGAALAAKAQGAREIVVVEPHKDRRNFLKEKSGLDVRSPDELVQDDLFDVIIDGVGYSGTRAEASARAKPGGVISHIGLGEASGGLDIRRMTLQEITFVGTYTYTMEDFRQTAHAIFDGRLGDMSWVETMPLEAGAAAFANLVAGKVQAPKIILKPQI